MNLWKVESKVYVSVRKWSVLKKSWRGWLLYRAGFNTHAEALAYADRMARKVQVTLPRPTEKFLATHRSHIAEWLPLGDEPENPVVWTFVGAGHIYIQRIEPGDFKPHEARKVALALLAAANCAEEEQQ